MLMFIPLIMAVFCPMTYFLVQEIIWPDYPLTLTVEPVYKIVRTIIAAPRHWEPATVKQCLNVFNPEYILTNGLATERPMNNWKLLATLHKKLLAEYPNLGLYMCAFMYISVLVIFGIIGHFCRCESLIEQNLDAERDEMVRSLIYGAQPIIPVTSVNTISDESKSQQLAMRNLMQAKVWQYVFTEQIMATKLLAKTLGGTIDRAFKVQNELDNAKALLHFREQVARFNKPSPAACEKCDALNEQYKQKMSKLKEQYEIEQHITIQDLRHLEAECANQKTEGEEAIQNLERSHRKEIANLEKKIKQQESEKQKKLDHAESRCKRSEEALEDAHMQQAHLSGELELSQKLNSSLEEQLLILKSSIREMDRDLQKATQEKIDVEKRAITAESKALLKEKTSDRAAADAIIEKKALEEKLSRANTENSSMCEHIAALEAQVETISAQKTKIDAEAQKQIQQKIMELETQNQTLQKTVQSLNTNASDVAEENKNNINQLVHNAKLVRDKLDKEMSALSIDKKKLEEKLKTLETQRRTSTDDDKQKTIEQLMESATLRDIEFQREIGGVRYENYHLEQKLEKLETELNEMRASKMAVPATVTGEVERNKTKVEENSVQVQSCEIFETPAQMYGESHMISETATGAENENGTCATAATPIAPSVSTISPPSASNSDEDSGDETDSLVIRLPGAETDVSELAEPVQVATPSIAPAAEPLTPSRSLMASKYAVRQDSASNPAAASAMISASKSMMASKYAVSQAIAPSASSEYTQSIDTAFSKQGGLASSRWASTETNDNKQRSGAQGNGEGLQLFQARSQPAVSTSSISPSTASTTASPAQNSVKSLQPSTGLKGVQASKWATAPGGTPQKSSSCAETASLSSTKSVQASKWAAVAPAPAITPPANTQPVPAPTSNGPPAGSLREQLFASLQKSPAIPTGPRGFDNAGRSSGKRGGRGYGRIQSNRP